MTLTPKDNLYTGQLRKYTREDKEKFALQWILHGEISSAAEACGIPRKTAAAWTHARWWERLVEVVRLRHKDEIEAKFEHIIAKSADQILERLDKGDAVVVKGKVVRVPVRAKDLAGVMATTQDKLRVSRNQPNNFSVTATLDLKQLASNFARAGRTYQRVLHDKKDPDNLPYFGQKGQNTDDLDAEEVIEEAQLEELEDDGSTIN